MAKHSKPNGRIWRLASQNVSFHVSHGGNGPLKGTSLDQNAKEFPYCQTLTAGRRINPKFICSSLTLMQI